MNVQVASDLHCEFLKVHAGAQRLVPQASDADVLVLAGDISVGPAAVALFGDWPTPVVYVAGNHEYYGQELSAMRHWLRQACAGTSIRFLDNEGTVIDGVRFLGSTLWTDYRLYEPQVSQATAMATAGKVLNDHELIRRAGRAFSPEDALAEHLGARAWLEEELRTAHPGPTVVVTHHGPHEQSVHPRYRGDVLSPAFCSDLSTLLPHATVWIHGHVHDAFDYVAAGCRVIANPRGYPVGRDAAGEFRFENDGFLPTCVVEVLPATQPTEPT